LIRNKTKTGYINWGANQSIMRPISWMTDEQIVKSIDYIKRLIKSKRFKYDMKILTERLRCLEEQRDFKCKK